MIEWYSLVSVFRGLLLFSGGKLICVWMFCVVLSSMVVNSFFLLIK